MAYNAEVLMGLASPSRNPGLRHCFLDALAVLVGSARSAASNAVGEVGAGFLGRASARPALRTNERLPTPSPKGEDQYPEGGRLSASRGARKWPDIGIHQPHLLTFHSVQRRECAAQRASNYLFTCSVQRQVHDLVLVSCALPPPAPRPAGLASTLSASRAPLLPRRANARTGRRPTPRSR